MQKLHKQMLGKNGQSQKTGRGITTYQEVLRTIMYLLVPFSSWKFTGAKCQGRSRKEIRDIWFDTLHGFHMLRYFFKAVWDKDSCSGVFWTSKTEKYLLKVNSWHFMFIHRLIFFNSNFYFFILFKTIFLTKHFFIKKGTFFFLK